MNDTRTEARHEKMLHLLLPAAFLLRSFLFFVGDTVLYPAAENSVEIVTARITWQNTAETVFNAVETLFHFAFVATAYHHFKLGHTQPKRKFALYGGLQVLAAAVCSLPFGCIDRVHFYNYLVPAYSSAIELAVLLAVAFGVNCYLRKKHTEKEARPCKDRKAGKST